jgi:hypothetical protein
VLNKLHKERIVVVRVLEISKSCEAFSLQALDTVAVRAGVDLLNGPETVREKTVSFLLYVGGDVSGGARAELSRGFEKGKVSRCKHCNAEFEQGIPEQCLGRKLGTIRIQKKDAVHEASAAGAISKFEIHEMTLGEALSFV